MPSKELDLSEEFIAAALLYRIIECEEEIPADFDKTDFKDFAQEMNFLQNMKTIQVNSDTSMWEGTEKGIEILDAMIDSYEKLLDLDIFSGVNLSLEVPDDLFDEEGQLNENELDPRFEPPSDEAEAEEFGTTDLRLPILDFMLESSLNEANSPYTPELRRQGLFRAVFLLELGSERFDDDEAFFDLKLESIITEIDEIVSSVPPWLDLAREYSPPQKLMEMIIDAGFVDANKRELLEDPDCDWLDKSKRSALVSGLARSFFN